jgi:hypothetical protein
MLVAQNSLGSVCPVPLTVRGNVFGSVREKRLSAGDGALCENWANCSDRLGAGASGWDSFD